MPLPGLYTDDKTFSDEEKVVKSQMNFFYWIKVFVIKIKSNLDNFG